MRFGNELWNDGITKIQTLSERDFTAALRPCRLGFVLPRGWRETGKRLKFIAATALTYLIWVNIRYSSSAIFPREEVAFMQRYNMASARGNATQVESCVEADHLRQR
jgi:hypothetical protein